MYRSEYYLTLFLSSFFLYFVHMIVVGTSVGSTSSWWVCPSVISLNSPPVFPQSHFTSFSSFPVAVLKDWQLFLATRAHIYIQNTTYLYAKLNKLVSMQIVLSTYFIFGISPGRSDKNCIQSCLNKLQLDSRANYSVKKQENLAKS